MLITKLLPSAVMVPHTDQTFPETRRLIGRVRAIRLHCHARVRARANSVRNIFAHAPAVIAVLTAELLRISNSLSTGIERALIPDQKAQ